MKDAGPESWRTVTVGDVCVFDKTKQDGTPATYVGLEDISNDSCEFLGSVEPATVKSATFRFGERHVLYGRLRPYLNKALAPDFTGHCSSEIFPLLPNESLDRRFLLHWLTSHVIRDKINATSTGARMPRANMNELLRFSFPLPPLEEQRRIVAILDEAFEGLSRAHAHAEANLQNARELFASVVARLLEEAKGRPVTLQTMLDQGWITNHLDGNHGANYPRKDEFVSEGVPYISANCLVGRHIDFGKCKYLTPERADTLRKGIAQDRDVIFAHNATVGPVALLVTDRPRVLLSTSLTYYRCDEERVLPEFLVVEMQSDRFRRQYEAVMAQATRNQVPITTQRRFTHLIPSLDDQRAIASVAVPLQAKCEAAEDAYSLALSDLDDLRQSLLEKAFAGELTT